MDSLCHPWFTTTNLSYRFPIFDTYTAALCGTTGISWYLDLPSSLLDKYWYISCRLPTYSPHPRSNMPIRPAGCQHTAPNLLQHAPSDLQVANIQPQTCSNMPRKTCMLPTYHPKPAPTRPITGVFQPELIVQLHGIRPPSHQLGESWHKLWKASFHSQSNPIRLCFSLLCSLVVIPRCRFWETAPWLLWRHTFISHWSFFQQTNGQWRRCRSILFNTPRGRLTESTQGFIGEHRWNFLGHLCFTFSRTSCPSVGCQHTAQTLSNLPHKPCSLPTYSPKPFTICPIRPVGCQHTAHSPNYPFQHAPQDL